MTKKLTEYRRKRRFDRTPEPSGTGGTSSKALRFIVHLHDATRLHYDLRLEMGGVLKSWAVPKGPSLNPSEQRLAVQVEDHPVEYGKFEGVIPEGNYGAGPVVIWDEGTYEARNPSPPMRSEAALQKAVEKGHLTFILHGKKLRGEFALIRLKGSRNWLLIKKSDAYATYKNPHWKDSSVVSKKTLEELKTKTTSTWTRKGRSELPYVRLVVPMTKRHPPEGAQWIWHEFGEGQRAFAQIEKHSTRLLSRTRMPLQDKFPAIAKALTKLPEGTLVDGEILSDEFRIIDLICLRGKDLRATPLHSRLSQLDKLRLAPKVKKAPRLKGAQGESWLAREKNSLYELGASRYWIRSSAKARNVFTNLEKKLWPKEGYTKKDLIDYYQSVSQHLLPLVKDRPMSLHRFPNGIQAPGFFQKDLTGYLPPQVKTFAHYSESSKRTIHYALCQDEATLLYLANLGCIELNPWLSRVPLIDEPDFCLIDLDPDDNSMDEVVQVALAYKALLDRKGFKAFCKTSGATGLHLYIPWKGSITYDESREFALHLSKIIFEKFPLLTSLDRSPAKRRKKIYLDCFQNSRGQTVVAPYSVRPRAAAPVSTPLHWREVKKRLDPKAFTIKTVPERVLHGENPWKGWDKSRNPVSKALKLLR